VSQTRKPVIVRNLTRDWYAGYAQADPGDAPELELLDGSGKLLRLAWNRIKWVCYVRELGKSTSSGQPLAPGNDGEGPERLLRRRFAARPRIPGVWLRLTLADGEELEGIAANDRTLLEGTGLLLTPPDTRSNTQRVFIPRTSIREVTILAVIQPKPTPHDRPTLQPDLFHEAEQETEDSPTHATE
jgi:hypothetical protein